MKYNFSVPSMWIQGTRAPFSDTDYATLTIAAVAPDGTTVQTYGPNTNALGDLHSGVHSLNMGFTDIDVPDGGSMAVVFTVINNGSWSGKGTIQDALDKLGSGLVGALVSGQLAGVASVEAWPAVLGALSILTALEITDVFLKDCDGVVVGETKSIGRAELDPVAGQGTWSWSTHYHGTESPTGCGDTSDYNVSYEVIASSLPGIVVPDVVGSSPTEAVNALAHVGLSGKIISQQEGLVDAPEVFIQNPSAGVRVIPSTTVELEVMVPRHGHQLP